MEVGTGKHTISINLAQGSADDMHTLCGVVGDGAPCDEDHSEPESTVGWFMHSTQGKGPRGKCFYVYVGVHTA